MFINYEQGSSIQKMGQTPRSKSQAKNNGTHQKVLSQGTLMWNFKVIALTAQKLLARLKFSNKRPMGHIAHLRKTVQINKQK